LLGSWWGVLSRCMRLAYFWLAFRRVQADILNFFKNVQFHSTLPSPTLYWNFIIMH
jgi:hypothetical protein